MHKDDTRTRKDVRKDVRKDGARTRKDAQGHPQIFLYATLYIYIYMSVG